MLGYIISALIGGVFGFLFSYRIGKKNDVQNNVYGNNNINL